MKRQKFFGIVLTVCVLLLALAGCAPSFEGNSVKTADRYELDIELLNGTDLHALELKTGDTLQIQFETEKGSLHMEIKAPDGTAVYMGNGRETTKFTLNVPMDGVYPIVVEGQRAKGRIRVEVEKAPGATEPALPEPEPATVTTEELTGPWHLAENEKDNATAFAAIPGAMEFGSSMEIAGDGHLSWYIGADGGAGTYSLSGNLLSADLTNDFDGSSMKMEFTAEETDGTLFLYTEYKGLLLCWSRGEGETGKGGS